jgi:tRNA modification GTPase
MKSIDQETIIAQCTPQGSGALALLRISGDDALVIASKMSALASGIPLHAVPSHTVHYGSVINQKTSEQIDQVLFIVMHAPKTFTGQHVVEITCHNNQFLIEAIIAQAVEHGARIAQQGEFSKRAFLHGKIDLVQAEAINELIHASTQNALKQALAQVEGTFSAWITTLEKELIKNLALADASFEFIDEEMEFGNRIKESIETVLTSLSTIKQTFNQQQHIRQGIRVALLGSVNAGKSSLFNALVKRNRAIVSPQAGTTRDTLEAGMYKEGYYVTFIDTAGLRETQDHIEQEGIQRSFSEAHQADIILLVFDSSRIMTAQEKTIYQELLHLHGDKIICIANKADKEVSHSLSLSTHALKTSALDTASIRALEEALDKKIRALFSHLASPFLLNTRQATLLISLEKKLAAILALTMEDAIEYEIVAYHLKIALENLTELSGKTISEHSMDAIFKEFCIGK